MDLSANAAASSAIAAARTVSAPGNEELFAADSVAEIERAQGVSLRSAVADLDNGGRQVTMSFGVVASPPGEPFSYQQNFRCADAALYEAKNAGRNQVRTASSTPSAAGSSPQRGPMFAAS